MKIEFEKDAKPELKSPPLSALPEAAVLAMCAAPRPALKLPDGTVIEMKVPNPFEVQAYLNPYLTGGEAAEHLENSIAALTKDKEKFEAWANGYDKNGAPNAGRIATCRNAFEAYLGILTKHNGEYVPAFVLKEDGLSISIEVRRTGELLLLNLKAATKQQYYAFTKAARKNLCAAVRETLQALLGDAEVIRMSEFLQSHPAAIMYLAGPVQRACGMEGGEADFLML